jgi:hypothetical protein
MPTLEMPHCLCLTIGVHLGEGVGDEVEDGDAAPLKGDVVILYPCRQELVLDSSINIEI